MLAEQRTELVVGTMVSLTHELIASNHMDIINVVSVAMPATVNQWLESEDDREQRALYWRQAFNCLTSELSPVDLICKCRSPENPDKTLVGCSNPQCGQWLHYGCLLHTLLTRVYDSLGTKKPHYPGESPAKIVPTTKTLGRPDSSKSATSTRAETQPPVVFQESQACSPGPMEQVHGLAPCSTGFLHQATALQTSAEKELELAAATTGSSEDTRRAYEGLFEARLDLQSVPTVWEVRDLRSDVSGGDRTWTENVNCLVCGSIIP
ncbi:hypothetical protein PCL_09577 [Purpureocillium lilacinum]|uniref:Uncharacterized protein n=1 Tax=Purpureocillium lilacinum TaxID=33203 RepID=A0A2U3DQK1_PURLI|nr:hypothetical protein PCL_09577 [Purpureocillium lilacinum]